MEYFLLILNLACIVGGFVIAVKRGRWVAVPLVLFIPYLGFLFALMLKTRCPYCREYMYPGAKVCPKCGRNLADGKVTTK